MPLLRAEPAPCFSRRRTKLSETVPQLLDAGLRVVDLSGAFRSTNPETFVQWYKLPAPPKNLAEEAVYGLPELYADQLRVRGSLPIQAAIRPASFSACGR